MKWKTWYFNKKILNYELIKYIASDNADIKSALINISTHLIYSLNINKL